MMTGNSAGTGPTGFERHGAGRKPEPAQGVGARGAETRQPQSIPTRARAWFLAYRQMPPLERMRLNNTASVFLMGVFPALAGSAMSVLLNLGIVWAAIFLVLGKLPFRLTVGDRLVGIALAVYAAVTLGTALLAPRHAGLFFETYWLFPFFFGWMLLPRLRVGARADLLTVFCAGCSFGAMAGFLVGLGEVLAGVIRPSAGSGNAAVFAMMALTTGAIGALNIVSENRNLRRLAAGGLLCGILAVVLSQTRGVLVTVVPILALVILFAPSAWRRFLDVRLLLGAAALLIAVVAIAPGSMVDRWRSLPADVQRAIDGDYATNAGERLNLAQASIPAIMRAPLFGYGIQNRMLALQPYYESPEMRLAGYTHPHNFALTALLDGGLVLLIALIAMVCAPLVLAWRTRHLPEGRRRLFMMGILAGSYCTSGLTQIMFKHDILDSFYVFAVLVAAASVVDAAARKRAAPDGRDA